MYQCACTYIRVCVAQVQHGNARRSLENVNKWNRKLLGAQQQQQQQANVSSRHDVAVWLTRLDIGGPSGYAPVSGACDPARSCALNRDEGLTSAFIIAHEVAHMFVCLFFFSFCAVLLIYLCEYDPSRIAIYWFSTGHSVKIDYQFYVAVLNSYSQS